MTQAFSSLEVDSGALLKILLHAAKHPSSDVLGVLVGRTIEASAGAATDGNGADADADDRKSNASAPSSSGRIVDALPLFHESVGLTPMLEVALLQAAAHAKARKLSLLGIYAANEHAGDQRLKPAARAAAEAVARGVKSSSGGSGGSGVGPGDGGGSSSSSSNSGLVLLVNNGALASFSEGKGDPVEDVLIPWVKGPSGWEEQGKRAGPSSSSATATTRAKTTVLRGAGGEERAKLFAEAVSKGLVDNVWDFDDHLLDLKKDWLNAGLLGG